MHSFRMKSFTLSCSNPLKQNAEYFLYQNDSLRMIEKIQNEFDLIPFISFSGSVCFPQQLQMSFDFFVKHTIYSMLSKNFVIRTRNHPTQQFRARKNSQVLYDNFDNAVTIKAKNYPHSEIS